MNVDSSLLTRDSRTQHPSGNFTWQEEGGPGGDVDLLQVLERLGVEEADGRAGGEGHPDPAACLHHVRHAHSLILVRLEALLRHRGRGVGVVLGWACQLRLWGPESAQEGNLRSPAVGCW